MINILPVWVDILQYFRLLYIKRKWVFLVDFFYIKTVFKIWSVARFLCMQYAQLFVIYLVTHYPAIAVY